jgi:hypothetical protein
MNNNNNKNYMNQNQYQQYLLQQQKQNEFQQQQYQQYLLQQQKLKEEQQKKLELAKKNNMNNSMNNNLNNSNMNNNNNNSMNNNLNNSINKPLSYEQLVKELQNAKLDRDSYAKNLEDQLKKNETLEKQIVDLKNKLNKSYEENDKLSKIINEQASIINGTENKNMNEFHNESNNNNNDNDKNIESLDKKIISLDLSDYVDNKDNNKIESNNNDTKNYLDYFSGYNNNNNNNNNEEMIKEENIKSNFEEKNSNSNLPVGSIILFKNSEKLPENWVICDGKNGNPDLSKLFLFGENNVIMYIIKIK